MCTINMSKKNKNLNRYLTHILLNQESKKINKSISSNKI